MTLTGCFSKDQTESKIRTNSFELRVKFTAVGAVESCMLRLVRLKLTNEYFFSLAMFMLNFKK